MAKIYETALDVERDKLGKTAKELRNSQVSEINTGIMATALGMVGIGYHNATKDVAELTKKPAPFTIRKKIDFWLSAATAIIGVIAFGLSFHSRSKARDAEAKLDKLGPKEVVMPEEVQIQRDGTSVHVTRLEKRLEKEAQVSVVPGKG